MADIFDETIPSDTDYTLEVTITDDAGDPIDITGWTWDANICDDYGTSATVLESYTIVNVDLPNGRIDLTLTQAQTNNLKTFVPVGTPDTQRSVPIGFHNLEGGAASNRKRWFEGTVNVSRDC